MTEFIKKIFAPQLHFEGAPELDKFARFFCSLYRIEIFKDGLDLILTKVQEKDIVFEVKLIKDWDTNLGCYLTEQSKVFNKVLGKFSRQISKKIILRSFAINVLAHEMAHALEFESGIDLQEDFRKCIGLDMKNREAQMLPLRAQIKRLMVDALKSYPQEQFISELFARFFELLSVCRDVQGSGDFTALEVIDFFANTTNFLAKIFNPCIKNMIDPKIAAQSVAVVQSVKLEAPEKKFADSASSFHKQAAPSGGKSWSKNVKSNASFQVGWQKYQEIEDKKS